MRSLRRGCLIVLLMGFKVPVLAQGWGATAHAGTLGVGAQVATTIGSGINFKGGVDVIPLNISIDVEDVDFDVKLPTPAVSLLMDIHASSSGNLRVTTGFMWYGRVPGIEAVPTDVVEFGGNEYTPAEVGTVRGSLGTRRYAFYAGVGYGNAVHSGLGFVFDLGIAYHGAPDFYFEATGTVSSDPQFTADLREEAEQINDDLPNYAHYYPVLSLGFSYGF